jgi:hypothetical protein
MLLRSRLQLETPSGQLIELNDAPDDLLRVDCPNDRALRELLRLATQLPFYTGPRSLRKQTNTLSQTIELRVAGRLLLRWPAGQRAQVKSLRLLRTWLQK